MRESAGRQPVTAGARAVRVVHAGCRAQAHDHPEDEYPGDGGYQKDQWGLPGLVEAGSSPNISALSTYLLLGSGGLLGERARRLWATAQARFAGCRGLAEAVRPLATS